jgi:hypothetical protein
VAGRGHVGRRLWLCETLILSKGAVDQLPEVAFRKLILHLFVESWWWLQER